MKPDTSLRNATDLPRIGSNMCSQRRRSTPRTQTKEEKKDETAPIYQVQSTYGRGRAPTPFGKTPQGPRVAQFSANLGSGMQPRYPIRPTGYCFNCGSPDHYELPFSEIRPRGPADPSMPKLPRIWAYRSSMPKAGTGTAGVQISGCPASETDGA